jgi:hypothetical protein
VTCGSSARERLVGDGCRLLCITEEDEGIRIIRARDGRLRTGGVMRKTTESQYDDMRDAVDFSGRVRGRYAGSIEPMSNLLLIEPELFETFPSAEAVNHEALRLLQKASKDATTSTGQGGQAKAS